MVARMVVLVLLLAVVACTKAPSISKPPRALAHLDLGMEGREYARLLDEKPEDSPKASPEDERLLKPVLDLGRRNLEWLEFINKHRDSVHRISLTAKETQQAFPVDKPREYNVAIILKQYQNLLDTLPRAMARVLVDGEPFTVNPPVGEADYKDWGRKTDIIYQIGARWLLLSPYIESYKAARKDDIRGFYFLNRETNLGWEYANWTQLPAERQALLRGWLVGMCFNSDALDQCEKDFAAATPKAGGLQKFHDKYFPLSKAKYDEYFRMGWVRKDIVWSQASPNVLRIPFVDPKDAGVLAYLRDNIEDEFKWTNWNLRIDFQDGDPDVMSHLRFEPGVTPHVDLPNTIVMDKNQPTTEYDSQWTIRHEFGHILGFPDCYHEFYDEDRQLMMSYQLDITNLMCSRRGVFQQTHFDELKRVYYK